MVAESKSRGEGSANVQREDGNCVRVDGPSEAAKGLEGQNKSLLCRGMASTQPGLCPVMQIFQSLCWPEALARNTPNSHGFNQLSKPVLKNYNQTGLCSGGVVLTPGLAASMHNLLVKASPHRKQGSKG